MTSPILCRKAGVRRTRLVSPKFISSSARATLAAISRAKTQFVFITVHGTHRDTDTDTTTRAQKGTESVARRRRTHYEMKGGNLRSAGHNAAEKWTGKQQGRPRGLWAWWL